MLLVLLVFWWLSEKKGEIAEKSCQESLDRGE
jgi:hypothetical protein